ncbi:MAG: hypothetical protein HQL27_08520 [Candidatus Omnitrophica bacterium]|nr:hypothetical protein [Candidatus Omnitrophota bacterium]
MNKISTVLKFFFVYVAALSIGIYFRLLPLIKYPTLESQDKATAIVLAQLRSKVDSLIASNSSNEPGFQKELLRKDLLDKLVGKNKTDVIKAIDTVAKNLDSNPASRGKYYLLASDSYYYYGLAKKIIDTGKIADKIKGSKYFNELMLAPLGFYEPLNFHPFCGLLTYKTLKAFVPDIDIMFAISFTPLFLTALILIPFLFICYTLNCRPLISFIASVFFLLSPIFVKRSTFGWFDDDPHNIFFPLLIACSFLLAIKHIESLKKTFFFAFLTALFFTAYSFFWHGWGLLFAILLASASAILLFNYLIFKEKSFAKNQALFILSFVIFSVTSVSLAFGINDFFILFKEGWQALKNFLNPQLSPWPDLYITVGELHKESALKLLDNTGGLLTFLFVAIGILHSLWMYIRRKDRDMAFSLFLLIYFIATLFIGFGAKRFALLNVVPTAICFALGLQAFGERFSSCKGKFGFWLKQISALSLILLISFPIIYINNNFKSLLNQIFNPTWEKALVNIKENTPQNSIVSSWWPPGHFIKSIAQRRVTFDGATINVPQAYWMSNVFLSQSEEAALGIMRMINSSGNKAVEFLQSQGFKLSEAVPIIKEIVKLDRSRAEASLNTILKDKSKVMELLKLTHSEPPPSYLLIYNEFVHGNIQLSLFGNWNFKAIEEINKNNKLIKEIPRRSVDEYMKFLWKLSGAPLRYGNPLPQIGQVGDVALFQEKISINLDNKDCIVDSKTYGKGIPYSIFYLEGNEIKEKIFASPNLSYSVLLYQDGKSFSCSLMDRALANSLLMRLYFFKGAGQKYFKTFSDNADITKRTEVLVFSVDWKSFEDDLSRKLRN